MNFTKTPLDTFAPSNPVGDFITWDTAEQGARAHTARHGSDVFKPMSARDAARFLSTPQDGRLDVDGYRYEVH